MSIEENYTKSVSNSHRKKFAQYFTPEPIAQLMVDWISENHKFSTLLEPAFGLGIFSRLIFKKRQGIKITCFDIDPVIYNTAKENFKNHSEVKLYLEDYLINDWDNKYDAIICNPPYFKFHDYENKSIIKKFRSALNLNLSGFTNIYTLFLLKAIYQLNKKGRAAFIIPSEFLNSDYGVQIKDYLLKSNTLRHIIIFDFKENVFENVLTTSAIIMLAKDSNDNIVHFTTIRKANQLSKINTIIQNYPHISGETTIKVTDLNPKIKWRNYYQAQQSQKYQNIIPFKNVAKVVRGIATGANEYFVFNETKALKYNIDKKNLLPCITKSKDVNKPFFTEEDFEKLKLNNSNIYLINAGKYPSDKHILKYLEMGEAEDIHKRYLTSKRNPWHLLEKRPPSPIWVGVFNRNGIKFIRNEAGISNLTTFHCIYLVDDIFYNIDVDLLFAYLLTDTAKEIFNDNRREYGNGLNKFEPNDLNNAFILDLSLLSENNVSEITRLYINYRESILIGKDDVSYIEKIDEIFKLKYRIGYNTESSDI